MPSRRPVAATPEIAGRQGGVFTAAQAVAEGWSPRSVRRRRAEGHWVRVVGRGLRATSAAPPTAFALAWAAQLTWPDAVVAGPTAARVWGMPVQDDPAAHVVAGRGRRSAGVVVHTGPLAASEIDVVAEGLVVTSRLRTAVDCLAWLPFSDALDLYAWLSTHGALDHATLAARTRARFGCRGTPQLLRLLARTASGAVSGAEHLFHDLLRRNGFDGWEANARVPLAGGGAVVDVLFRSVRVAVEIDGERAHRSRAAFVGDRRRQNDLVAAGWTVLRFTWWDLTERPAGVVAQLRTVLAASERRHAAFRPDVPGRNAAHR